MLQSGTAQLIEIGTAAYRRLTWALLMAGLSTFSLLYSVQPLLPEFASRFHLSAESSSLAVSLATGSMAGAILLAGILSDRFGRKPVMMASLFAAGILGVLTAAAPGWIALLLLRAASGIALAGVPAVAMAYVSEEVSPKAIAHAMGLYVAGSAFGGMTGRLGAGLVAEWFGWRAALAAMGLLSLTAAFIFWLAAPDSRNFSPRRHRLPEIGANLRSTFLDPALRLLYIEGFIFMGTFVTLYNYIGFRLMAPPYSLSQAAIGAIFSLYLIGSASSAFFGRLASRKGVGHVLWRAILLMLAGILITVASPLWAVILGVGVVTAGFFGSHAVASSWIGRRAFANRGQATAFYLLFYYFGSSLAGTAGGIAWSYFGWNGVALFMVVLCAAALGIAYRLTLIPPLPQPRPPITPGSGFAAG